MILCSRRANEIWINACVGSTFYYIKINLDNMMEDKNIKKHKFQTITNINNVVCWGWKSCGFWLEYKLWKYIPNMHNNVIKKATKQHGCELNIAIIYICLAPQFTIRYTIRNYCDGYKCCFTFKYFLSSYHIIYMSALALMVCDTKAKTMSIFGYLIFEEWACRPIRFAQATICDRVKCYCTERHHLYFS